MNEWDGWEQELTAPKAKVAEPAQPAPAQRNTFEMYGEVWNDVSETPGFPEELDPQDVVCVVLDVASGRDTIALKPVAAGRLSWDLKPGAMGRIIGWRRAW